MCHMDYASSVWFFGSNTRKQLQITKNKITRFILGKNNRSHVGPEELIYLKWLNVENRVKQLQLNYLFDIYNGSSPSYLNEHFVRVNTLHSYNTRSNMNNFIKLWNSLPVSLKLIDNKMTFKDAVKNYLSSEKVCLESSSFLLLSVMISSVLYLSHPAFTRTSMEISQSAFYCHPWTFRIFCEFG